MASALPSPKLTPSGSQHPSAGREPQSQPDALDQAPLSDLLERFLHWILHDRRHSPATAEAYRRDCSRFIAFVQDRRGRPVPAGEITSLDIEKWLASTPELSSTTVRRRLYALSSFLRHLKDRGALITKAAGRRTATTTFWRMFQRILRRAGLADSGITAHTLRHRFAPQLLRSGADVATVAELLGHANSASKRAVVERMQDAFSDGAGD